MSNGGSTSMRGDGTIVSIQGSMAGRCASLSSSTAPLACYRCHEQIMTSLFSPSFSFSWLRRRFVFLGTNKLFDASHSPHAGWLYSTLCYYAHFIGICLYHGATRII
jgi:hypothetical protein